MMNRSIVNKVKIITLTSLFCGLTALSCTVAASEGDGHDHGKETAKSNPVVTAKANNEHSDEQEKESGHQHGADEENDGHGHGSAAQEGEEHEEGITFSAQKMQLANIKVAALTPKIFAKTIYAPGEIKVNGYTSYIVSPRTESVVVNRHASLGEHVSKGQPLVTLFSEAVASAQAQYRIAYSEWKRAKKLGKGTVSESRLLKSETDHNAAYGRLVAYGLTTAAINAVIKDNSLSLGEYTLIAQRAGAVLNDDFSQGQRVSPGEKIMILADENNLWVEARVSPNKQLNLPVGTLAKVEFSTVTYDARVIQEAHTIDPNTRTRIVRLSVDNKDDSLHAGMFVNVNFQFNTDTPVMAVPETALMRGADGDWTVFVEDHPGEFKAVEVELGQSLGNYRQISGIAPNTRVVMQGAFFVASEIAKGGFDPHGH